jgi:hypothetical protein
MILPKSGDKSEVYLQVQNQLRLQNRQLILQLCRPDDLSTDKVDSKISFFAEKKKKAKKTFEDATTNTDGSCSNDGYR